MTALRQQLVSFLEGSTFDYSNYTIFKVIHLPNERLKLIDVLGEEKSIEGYRFEDNSLLDSAMEAIYNDYECFNGWKVGNVNYVVAKKLVA